MTIGFPGSTDRYLSSWGVNQRIENSNKPRIEVRGLKQDIWRKAMQASDAVRIKYASKYAGSSNYWKNSIGMNRGLANLRRHRPQTGRRGCLCGMGSPVTRTSGALRRRAEAAREGLHAVG